LSQEIIYIISRPESSEVIFLKLTMKDMMGYQQILPDENNDIKREK
jgi:hypothetical protein